MIFNKLTIPGVFEIILEPHVDQRGFFMRTFDKKIFKEQGLKTDWVQQNHSFSKNKFTVRGFHFQYPPFAETKLLRVIQGEILFTVIDLRKSSKTFGKWVQVTISAEKKNMLYVPRGCSPCMCTLTTNCHLMYNVDNYYSPENEDNFRWNDPDLAIPWPVKDPEVISERDNKAKSFEEFVELHGGIKL